MNIFFIKNKSKLIRQFMPLLYVVMLAAILLCGIFMYYYSVDIMLNSERRDKTTMLNELVEKISENKYRSWYFDYWENHYDEMDLVADKNTEVAILEKNDEFIIEYEKVYDDYLYNRLITEKEIDGESFYVYEDISALDPNTLTPKLQKLLAEYVYLSYRSIFDTKKMESNVKHLFCVKPLDGDNAFYFFSGKRSSEVYGTNKDEIYPLGTKGVIPRKKYPNLYKTYEDGEVVEGEALFISDRTSNNRFHFYVPLFDENGKTLCVIVISGKLHNIWTLIQKPFFFILAFLIVAILSAAFFVARMLRKMAIDPINHIHDSIKEYGSTKNSQILKEEMSLINKDRFVRNNEIGFLSDELSSLGDELTKYIEDVKEMSVTQERLNTELDLATRIQKSALTEDFENLPKDWNLRICGSMDPAKEVGGDFYDFYVLDENHIALIIGDVSGKGVPAALLMMICLAIFKNELRYSKDPSLVLAEVNNTLCTRSFEDMFITAWIGIMEVSTGIIQMANAGHENPIIKRKDGKIEEYVSKHDLVLAAMEGINYKSEKLKLNRGDMLIVYTDGVPEAINSKKEQYSVERLKKCLNSHECNSPKEYIQCVTDDMDIFVKEADQFDDTTMFVVCYDEIK